MSDPAHVAWSYQHPVPESARIAGLVWFYNDKVDICVDGAPHARPEEPVLLMYQLRIYDITPGRMDEFIDVFWRVAELREAMGFEVIGPWIEDEANRFVWIVGYHGPDGFAAATAAYYDSPQRASLDPDPAEFLEAVDTRMLTAVTR